MTRQKHDRTILRFALGLVVAFGTAGVLAYAHGLDEKTLAGPIIEPGPPDGCPAKFPILVRVEKINLLTDTNRDGFVCTDEDGLVFVDNDADSRSGGSRHASGHGNFIAGPGGIEKQLFEQPVSEEGQDISFSFHGIGINGATNEAKGEFEFHDQTGVGPDLTVHGDVLCLAIDDNVATLIGVVTRSNDAGLPVNERVMWTAQDNGEGNGASPDTLSRPSVARQKLLDCDFKRSKLSGGELVSGNIQVDEDETASDVPTELEEKGPEDQSSASFGVEGHGNFFDGGKKIVQDLSFSFHAIGEGLNGEFIGDAAKGEFEYHDQTAGGPDLTVHGDVICATVTGNSARLVGIVTRSNDKGLLVQTIVTWQAVDNGEGAGGAPDQVSRLAPVGVNKASANACGVKAPAANLQPVLNGNIQVR